MMKISLCMIVRDEEADLPACLESVKGVVDEICVVDTGSTDRTVAIAEEFGARVEHFTWCDDFSAARNVSLAMAQGDWILVLDADETLEQADVRQSLIDFATRHPQLGGQVTIVDRQEQGDLRSRVTRFLPTSKKPNYRGRFHEQPHFGDSLAPAQHTGVELVHHGYTKESIANKDKVARNRHFLSAMIEVDPEDSYLHYQLGRTYLVGEDFDAALDSFTSALDNVPLDAPYLPLLVELTGHCLRKLDRSLEALDLLQQVAPAFADRPDTCYLEALLAFDVGKLELAESRFQRCLTLEEPDGVGGSSATLARTWGPAYHLAVLREVLEMPEEARAWYERALEFKPDHSESREGLARLACSA